MNAACINPIRAAIEQVERAPTWSAAVDDIACRLGIPADAVIDELGSLLQEYRDKNRNAQAVLAEVRQFTPAIVDAAEAYALPRAHAAHPTQM